MGCTTHFDDYIKTAECARVVVSRTSRAHQATTSVIKKGLLTSSGDVSHVVEWVIFLIFLVLIGLLIWQSRRRRTCAV